MDLYLFPKTISCHRLCPDSLGEATTEAGEGASPTCLSDRHLHRGGGRALPDDVVARHDDLVAAKFLQLCQNEERPLNSWLRVVVVVPPEAVYSRVSSNSESEALLTVLKVLLALQKGENKEELSA